MASETDSLLECLLALANYHGQPTTRAALLSGLPLDNLRLMPSLFERAAARIDFTSKILHRSLESLDSALLPAILLLEDEHACLLVGWSVDGEQARVIYPELNDAVVEIERQELKQKYSGRVIFARPRFRFDERTPAVKHRAKINDFWQLMRENMSLYRDVLVAALFINMFALVMPVFTMNIYDRVVPNYALETLWILSLGVAIVVIADFLLRTMRSYFLDLASKRVDIKMSAGIMEQVLGLRLEAKPLSVGSFAANLRSFENVRDFITSASMTAVIDLPFTLLFMLVIFWIAGPMVLPLLVGVSLVLLYALTTQHKMEELTETTFRASAQKNATLVESLVGLDTIKAMGAEGIMQRRWESASVFLARISIQLRLLASSSSHVVMWVQQWVAVAVIIVGVYLIAAGELSMGGLIACSMLTSRAIAPLGSVVSVLTQYHQAKTAYYSLNDVMDKPVERSADTRFLSRQKLQGRLEFRNVSFCYPETDNPVLRDVSFTVEPGQHVAILGRIGSGKSSLQKLILGLYQPTEGKVLVDGVDLRQLDPADLRQQVGYVPQEAVLFYGSLRENLVLVRPQADDEAVVRAAEFAGLTEFVNNHPQGFDMTVGERGDTLSGGQRKAVSLARAVIHDPSMLLLDEPTGSMDHSTEAWVTKQLATYTENKTMVMVTHRTSLLSLADRIIVIDSGQIVADGPRDTVVEALRQGRIGKAS